MIAWRKSTFSDSAGTCVEVARAGAVVLVQDSKTPAAAGGHMQAWSVDEWQELLRAVRLTGPAPVGASTEIFGHVAIDVVGPEELLLGLHRHEKLAFSFAEWNAFVAGVLAGEFDPERLSGPVSSVAGGAGRSVEPNAGGSDRAATGADVIGPYTAPVAAELQNSPAGRTDRESHREVAASTGDGEVVRPTVPGRPGPSDEGENQEDLLISWSEDPSLGEPQGPSKGAARRAGQGPGFADRSGVEAAGTGALPPVLVPGAAEWTSEAAEAATLELCAAWPIEIGSDLVFAEQVGRIAAKAIWPLAYQAGWTDREKWTEAVAPLVPTDGAS